MTEKTVSVLLSCLVQNGKFFCLRSFVYSRASGNVDVNVRVIQLSESCTLTTENHDMSI